MSVEVTDAVQASGTSRLNEQERQDIQQRDAFDLQERDAFDLQERDAFDLQERDAFDLQERDALTQLDALMSPCELCPRHCHADRRAGVRGVCGATDEIRVARAALHYWEEPPISGTSGSGAIFFSHCPMHCGFCQNASISAGGFGLPVSTDRLSQIMLELQQQDANNINLVTATHYAPQTSHAIAQARRQGLHVPVVYNTSAFERPDVVDLLSGFVDVWLPDYKYASVSLARDLSGAPTYPDVAMDAIARMVSAVERAGGRQIAGEQDIMVRGVIVRHLVLPGHVDDSLAALRRLWDQFGNRIDLSVMNQYTPVVGPAGLPKHPEMGRALSDEEYEQVLDYADDLGFDNLWWQQGGTVEESFIPAFDATGVLAPASDSSAQEGVSR